MNYPILALATSKPKDCMGATLVSTGGPVFEVSQLNLETGGCEMFFRCNETKGDLNKKDDINELKKNDIPSVPEFYKETTFRDN